MSDEHDPRQVGKRYIQFKPSPEVNGGKQKSMARFMVDGDTVEIMDPERYNDLTLTVMADPRNLHQRSTSVAETYVYSPSYFLIKENNWSFDVGLDSHFKLRSHYASNAGGASGSGSGCPFSMVNAVAMRSAHVMRPNDVDTAFNPYLERSIMSRCLRFTVYEARNVVLVFKNVFY